MLQIPHQLVGAPLGSTVMLECSTEAHPISLNYWTRDKDMIHESDKYHSETQRADVPYKSHMTLTIRNVKQARSSTKFNTAKTFSASFYILNQGLTCKGGVDYARRRQKFCNRLPVRSFLLYIHVDSQFDCPLNFCDASKLLASNPFLSPQSDFGTYKCVAKNPRGETDGVIRLYSKCQSSHPSQGCGAVARLAPRTTRRRMGRHRQSCLATFCITYFYFRLGV